MKITDKNGVVTKYRYCHRCRNILVLKGNFRLMRYVCDVCAKELRLEREERLYESEIDDAEQFMTDEDWGANMGDSGGPARNK